MILTLMRICWSLNKQNKTRREEWQLNRDTEQERSDIKFQKLSEIEWQVKSEDVEGFVNVFGFPVIWVSRKFMFDTESKTTTMIMIIQLVVSDWSWIISETTRVKWNYVTSNNISESKIFIEEFFWNWTYFSSLCFRNQFLNNWMFSKPWQNTFRNNIFYFKKKDGKIKYW